MKEYREACDRCCATPWMAGKKWKEFSTRPRTVSEVHHIWGGKGRMHLSGNLICVSKAAHDYCHKYPIHGRIVCMFAKLMMGGSEWMPADLDKCACLSIAGWLQTDKVTEAIADEPTLKQYRDELIRVLERET